MLNAISLLAVGFYLIAVMARGNLNALGDQLLGEVGYVKWIVALGVLLYFARNSETKDIGQPLLVAAIIGLGFKTVDTSSLKDALSGAIKNV